MNALALVLVAVAAAPPGPGAAKKVPVASPLETRAVEGGWFLEPAQAADRSQLGNPSLDTSGTRFLTAWVQYDEEQVHVHKSAAVVATSAGRVEKVIDLQKLLPVDWRISGDGRAAAVLAQDPEDPESVDATLLVYDLSKASPVPVRLAVSLDTRIVAGKSTFALESLPAWLPDEDLEGIDEHDMGGSAAMKTANLPGAALRPPEPVVFVRANGDRVPAKTPMLGEVAAIRGDGGFVALAKGKLVRVDAKLAKTWEAAVGFDGAVAASDDGSLIVVADLTPGKATRTLVAFDASGARRGEVSFPAPLAVDLAIAPDGSGFLVAAAPLVSPTIAKYDGLPEVMLACYSADGTLRWSQSRKRDVPSRAFAHLALANGSAVAVAGWVADVDDTIPQLLVFGKDGKPLYTTEGPFDSAGLDPSGAAVWTLEGSLLSRLTLKSLSAGRATNPK
jgi:hypothetical protein